MYNYTLNYVPVLPHDTNALNVQTAAADYAKAQDVDADDVFQLKRYRSAKTELNGLVTDCSVFETTELAATHARLYQLLTRAYSYYVTMKTDSDAKVRSEYKKALKDFIAERGHKFLKSSSDMHRVVKCVFGGGRRRVRQRVEVEKRLKRWWSAQADGQVLLTVRWGTRVIEWERGKAAIVVGEASKLIGVLEKLIAAAQAGELDDFIAAANKGRQTMKRKAA